MGSQVRQIFSHVRRQEVDSEQKVPPNNVVATNITNTQIAEELRDLLLFLSELAGHEEWRAMNIRTGYMAPAHMSHTQGPIDNHIRLPPHYLQNTMNAIWQKHTLDGQTRGGGRQRYEDRGRRQEFYKRHTRYDLFNLIKDAVIGTLHSGVTLIGREHFVNDNGSNMHWHIIASAGYKVGQVHPSTTNGTHTQKSVQTEFYKIAIKYVENGRRMGVPAITGMWPFAFRSQTPRERKPVHIDYNLDDQEWKQKYHHRQEHGPRRVIRNHIQV